jgi:hypothetical protein
MDKTAQVKQDIMALLYQTYGDKVGSLFQTMRGNEVLPIFVQNSYIILKQNLGKYKAAEQLDFVLSKYGVSVASYEE